MIRKILVPIRGDGKGETVLGHAAALARRFEAHVEATHCRPGTENLTPFGVPVPTFLREQLAKQAVDVADAEEKRLRETFDQLAAQFGLPVVDKPNGDGPSVSWVEESGKQIDVIKSHGRLSDIIVVAKPDRDRNLGANTLKTALFNTGRPVLMCPPGVPVPQVLGERIAIAWNGSLQATRAVALTFGLLAKATEVIVLTADREEVHGASAADLQSYLSLRGVEASLHRFAAKKRIGDSLLAEAAAVGADLLIMGAYGNSHEMETIFRGNTQAVVDGATMPVVLVR